MNKRLSRVADERGFTMVTVMLSMMILGMFAVASWATVNGDLPTMRQDMDRKRAYEAAEAGIQWYTAVLERDSNAWTSCGKNGQAGVALQGQRSSGTWKTVGDNTDEKFIVELMPNDGKTCDTSDPGPDMLDPTSKTLRIRSTGWANGKQRQIVATFRHSGFLDFIYFTKWETGPPSTSSATNYLSQCDKPRSQRTSTCSNIQFIGTDSITGPLHTEDESLLVCGSPTFGQISSDHVEVTRGTQSSWYKQNSGCSGTPKVQGTLYAPAGQLQPPQDNRVLKNVANIVIQGQSCLVFNGNQLAVYKNQPWGGGTITCTGTPDNYTLTGNTVIYVDHNGTCPWTYTTSPQSYDSPSTCGNAAVSGNYSNNITIGAAQDIIVNGDFRANDSSLMAGLIGSHYVRIYHPASGSYPIVHYIDAAILATSGSFITDNYDKGSSLGTIHVTGAIAQYWRGPVGTGSGGSSSTGYVKDYTYNYHLQYASPPNFLDPEGSAWRMLRTSEQSPVKNN